MIKFNDLSRQQNKIYSNIHKSISRVLKHGKYIMGPEISELENKLSSFVNSKYCITVSSGKDALLISLMALNIQKDDEIITSPFSYFATCFARFTETKNLNNDRDQRLKENV